MTDELTTIRRHLLRNAYLFEDPNAYASGVMDALEAVGPLLAARTPAPVTTLDLTRGEVTEVVLPR